MKKEIPEEILSMIVKHMFRELRETEASQLEKWIMKEKGNWKSFIEQSNEISKEKNARRTLLSKIK